MAFWGETLKPGQRKPLKIQNADVLHLSQACLHDPKPGKTTLQVIVRGTTYSIAVFEKDKREHDCLDLFFDSDQTTFTTSGTSEVHLMGYIEPSSFDEEEEEEGQAQQVVPKSVSPKLSPSARPASPKATPKSPVAKTAPAPSPKVASPKAAAMAAADSDDDDMLDEFEDEEEEEEILQQQAQSPSAAKAAAAAQAAKAASPKLAAKAASPKAAAAKAPLDDDDDDLDEDEEGEEELGDLDDELLEEGEESDLDDQPQQKLPQKSPVQAAQSPKRKMEAAPASPLKKGKVEGSDEKAAYVKKLVDFIKANGKTSLGQLGSKVPRPQGVSKMKVVFEENKDKFTVVGDQVTLK